MLSMNELDLYDEDQGWRYHHSQTGALPRGVRLGGVVLVLGLVRFREVFLFGWSVMCFLIAFLRPRRSSIFSVLASGTPPPVSDFSSPCLHTSGLLLFSIPGTCDKTDAEDFPIHYVPVPVLSLSRLLQAHEHIDLVSFDCQGATRSK